MNTMKAKKENLSLVLSPARLDDGKSRENSIFLLSPGIVYYLRSLLLIDGAVRYGECIPIQFLEHVS